MNRRVLLRAGAAAGLVTLLGGHTPYGQWVVYRKKHLLIGCHKDDPETYALAKRVVALLAEHLPAAKARVARAPFAGRLASLLGTDQLEVAVLGASDAGAMRRGEGPFSAYGPVALRLLVPVGERLLVAHADFPGDHAALVTGALLGTDLAPVSLTADTPAVPWHPASRARIDGAPAPAAD